MSINHRVSVFQVEYVSMITHAKQKTVHIVFEGRRSSVGILVFYGNHFFYYLMTNSLRRIFFVIFSEIMSMKKYGHMFLSMDMLFLFFYFIRVFFKKISFETEFQNRKNFHTISSKKITIYRRFNLSAYGSIHIKIKL